MQNNPLAINWPYLLPESRNFVTVKTAVDLV